MIALSSPNQEPSIFQAALCKEISISLLCFFIASIIVLNILTLRFLGYRSFFPSLTKLLLIFNKADSGNRDPICFSVFLNQSSNAWPGSFVKKVVSVIISLFPLYLDFYTFFWLLSLSKYRHSRTGISAWMLSEMKRMRSFICHRFPLPLCLFAISSTTFFDDKTNLPC